jgi:uncharacterized membrane protein
MINIYAIIIVLITIISVLYLSNTKNIHLVKILDWIPPILFAYIIPALIVKLFNIDTQETSLPNWSKNFLVPLAILMVMTTLSIRQLKLVGWKPIVVFLSGSFWIALFPVLYYFLFYNDGSSVMIDYWKGIPPIVGSWIGGSTSQVVLKEIVECPENLFLTVLVVDNVLVNVWTILMFQVIKNTPKLNKLLNISEKMPNMVVDNVQPQPTHKSYLGVVIILILSICISLYPINFIQKIIALSLIGLFLSSFLKIWDRELILKIGHIIIVLIMAILGLRLNFESFTLESSFVSFLIIWLISHFIFMIFVAKILNVNAVWIPIASMANVGGIATTPAVTATYNKELMPHAVILAILSMVSGTAWGGLTIWLFNRFINI